MSRPRAITAIVVLLLAGVVSVATARPNKTGPARVTVPRRGSHPHARGASVYWKLERRYVAQQHELGRLGREVRRLRREHAARTLQAVGGSSLERDFLCIYAGENGGYGWGADTGNGYHGGLQMDSEFERSYGSEFVRAWGHASNWPESVQIAVAIRAWLSGRGFAPWPVTSRACGLR